MTDRYVYGDCWLCEGKTGYLHDTEYGLKSCRPDDLLSTGQDGCVWCHEGPMEKRPCPLCALIEERAERYYRRADDIAAAKGKPPPKADPFLDRAIAELKEEGLL